MYNCGKASSGYHSEAEREDKGTPELERDARRVRDYNRKRELVPIVSQGSTLALKSPQAAKESVCYVALIHSKRSTRTVSSLV